MERGQKRFIAFLISLSSIIAGTSSVPSQYIEAPALSLVGVDYSDSHDRVIQASMDSAYVIENVCGIKLKFESQTDDNLKNFCLDSFKTRRDAGNVFLREEPSEDVRKCYSFLCAWYQEKCHWSMSGALSEFGKQEIQKCGCLYNLWSGCKCDLVLNNVNNNGNSAIGDDDPQTKYANIDIRFGDKKERKTSNYNIPPIHKNFARDLDLDGYQNDDTDSFVFIDESYEQPQTTADPFSVKSYNEEQRKCFTVKKVPYNGQCVKLKSEEVCGAGEWLVLKKPTDDTELTQLEPICEIKKCTAKNEVWWPSENQCINKTSASKKYCGKNVLVEHDSFGDGYCTCYDDSGSFEDSTDCYEFYQQGPCRVTEVVTYDKESGNAVCSRDLCFDYNHPTLNRNRNRPKREENVRVKKEAIDLVKELYFTDNESNEAVKYLNPYNPNLDEEFQRFDRFKRQAAVQKKYYAPFGGNGQCYKIGPQQICDSLGTNAQFKFHTVLKVPECFVSIGNALHLIDSRLGCKVDENNNCREKIKLAETSEEVYLMHLKNQARKKRESKG